MAEEKKKTTKKVEKEEKVTKKPVEEPIEEPTTKVEQDIDQEKEVAKETKKEEEATPVEEVKIEKKFCTKCGKELSSNETCSCTQTASPKASNINTEALSTYAKNFLDTVINMYKKPSSTIDNVVAKNNFKESLIMLVIIALTYGLYVTGSFTSIISLFSSFSDININSAVNIPYFKIFLYMSLINFLVSFIPITLAFILNKICGKGELNYQKSISLYATSYAPTVITNLLMAIMYYLNILSWVGAIIGLIINVTCFFNYLCGYVRLTKPSEEKKSYILSSFVLIWVVVSLIISVLFITNLLTDFAKDVSIKNHSNSFYDFYD